MTEASASIISKWYGLAGSEQRAIADQFGVSPQGAEPLNRWTLKIMEAAISQDRIAAFKSAIIEAAKRVPPVPHELGGAE